MVRHGVVIVGLYLLSAVISCALLIIKPDAPASVGSWGVSEYSAWAIIGLLLVLVNAHVFFLFVWPHPARVYLSAARVFKIGILSGFSLPLYQYGIKTLDLEAVGLSASLAAGFGEATYMEIAISGGSTLLICSLSSNWAMREYKKLYLADRAHFV